MNVIQSLLQILESSNDSFETAVNTWKESIKKKYPNVASRLKFKAVDGGKRISAEVPGQDRCYGVFDIDKGSGEVLDEAARHITGGVQGVLGEMLVIDDGKIAKALAKTLHVDDGWDLVDIGNGLFAAYNAGDRLTFYTNHRDYDATTE